MAAMSMRLSASFASRKYRTVLIASAALVSAAAAFASFPHPSSNAAPHGPADATLAPQKQTSPAAQASTSGPSHIPSSSQTKPPATGIATQLNPGQRAFSVRVSEDDIVGGFVQPGYRVDVLTTIPGSVQPQKDAPNFPDRSKAIILLQNVLVLAVGASLSDSGSAQADARTVSLSLAPDQLAKLTLALRLGRVSLAIRKPGDNAIADTSAATLQDILGEEKQTAEQPSPTGSASIRPAAHRGIPVYLGPRVVLSGERGAE